MSETPRHERFILGIGSLTIAWAMTEMFLDTFVGTLFHEFGGHPSEPKIPRTGLARKIVFAKACFNTTSELLKDRDEAIAILDQMAALGEERHWCIHGVALNLHKENEPLLQTRNRFYDNLLFTEKRPISPEIVADLLYRVVVFTQGFTEFVLRWLKSHGFREIDELGGEQDPHWIRQSPPNQKT